MKRLMTLLALTASFALMTPVSAEAHDRGSRHRHGHSHYQQSGYRQLVFVGYDRWGRPQYQWRTVRSYHRPVQRYPYGYPYRYSRYSSGPRVGFSLNLGGYPYRY
jgi:hypothetical protein